MSVVYSIRWRLVYLDNRQFDEMPAGSTIMNRRPNPAQLHLITVDGEQVHTVEIPPSYKPIFYRQRSITQYTNGDMGETELDATVFGYGRVTGGEPEKELWVWIDGRAMDCPPEYIAQRSIELQIA